MTDEMILGLKKKKFNNRKRNNQAYEAALKHFPECDLHIRGEDRKDGDGLQKSIEKLEEFVAWVEEDVDVRVPFTIIHGRGKSQYLKGIVIEYCRSRGFQVSTIPEWNAGITRFDKEPDRRPLERTGLPNKQEILLMEDYKWGKELDDLLPYLLRHKEKHHSGEWSARSDLNGNELKAGDLVRIYPYFYDINEDGDFGLFVEVGERVSLPTLSPGTTIRKVKFCTFKNRDHPFLIVGFDDEDQAILSPVGEDLGVKKPFPAWMTEKISGEIGA